MKRLTKQLTLLCSVTTVLLVAVAVFITQGKSSVRELGFNEIVEIRNNHVDRDRVYNEMLFGETSSTTTYLSVHDLMKTHKVIITAEFVGHANTIGMGNGIIEIGGRKIDDTAYYVETLYLVDEVYSGRDSDALKNSLQSDNKGDIITVLEYIGFGAEADENNLTDKDGKYLLLLSTDQTNQLYVTPLYSINKVDEDGNITWASQAVSVASKLEGITNLDRLKQALK